MSLFNINNTCDIYRSGVSPPAAPSVAGVACYLQADFRKRCEIGEDQAPGLRFTHTMLVAPDVDVRDYKSTAFTAASTPDIVYFPNRTGTPFKVVHVERRNRGTSADHKRVYLDRGTPTWPTNEL